MTRKLSPEVKSFRKQARAFAASSRRRGRAREREAARIQKEATKTLARLRSSVRPAKGTKELGKFLYQLRKARGMAAGKTAQQARGHKPREHIERKRRTIQRYKVSPSVLTVQNRVLANYAITRESERASTILDFTASHPNAALEISAMIAGRIRAVNLGASRLRRGEWVSFFDTIITAYGLDDIPDDMYNYHP